MSDAPPTPGYWMASDGKWYSTELHPDYVSPPPSLADDASDTEVPPVDSTESIVDPQPHHKHNRTQIVAVGILVLILITAAAIYVIQVAKSPTTTASLVVQPCRSIVSMVKHPPTTPPTNYLYAPASGATTPQAAINDVESTAGSRGLLAACPYITSRFVWGAAHLAHIDAKKFPGKVATQAAAAEDEALLHGDGTSPVVKITTLHCTSTQCTATVRATTISSYDSSASSDSYTVNRYKGKWYVSRGDQTFTR